MPSTTLRTPRLLVIAGMAVLASLAAPPPVAAQPVLDAREDLDAERPEAWAMRWFTAALDPTGFGPPPALAAGGVALGLEVGSLPRLSEAERRVGFHGRKVEDLNRSPLFGRLRLDVGVGFGLVARVGWIPPVEIDGLTPGFFSLGLARTLYADGRFRLAGELRWQTGEIDGDLTCDAGSAAAGDDPVANPFSCEEPSNDHVSLDSRAGELSAAWRLGATRRWEGRIAASYRRLDAETDVDARWGGLIDRSVLRYDGNDWSASVGISRAIGLRVQLAMDVVYSPLDVVRDPSDAGPSENDALWNLRFLASWRAR